MNTPRGQEPWAPLVLVLGLAGLIVMADNWVVSPLLPSIARTMGGSVLGISFLGQGMSMAVGGTIAAFAGWRWVFIAYGIVGLLVMGVLVRKGRSLPPEPTVGRGPLIRPYRHLLGRWRSLRIYLVAFGEGVFILGLFSYLGALLVERHGLGPLGVGLSLTAFGAASVIFGRLSGRVAGRIGRVNLIGLALLVGGVAALVLSQVANLPLSLVAIFALGAAFMLAHSSVLTIATELAAQHRGVAMSLVAFAFMGGGALGTTLAGRVVATRGFQSYLFIWGVGLGVLGIAARIALAGAEARSGRSVPAPVSDARPS